MIEMRSVTVFVTRKLSFFLPVAIYGYANCWIYILTLKTSIVANTHKTYLFYTQEFYGLFQLRILRIWFEKLIFWKELMKMFNKRLYPRRCLKNVEDANSFR